MDNSGDENPFKELIVNNSSKIDSSLTQTQMSNGQFLVTL